MLRERAETVQAMCKEQSSGNIQGLLTRENSGLSQQGTFRERSSGEIQGTILRNIHE
jgi:hypothetical protein